MRALDKKTFLGNAKQAFGLKPCGGIDKSSLTKLTNESGVNARIPLSKQDVAFNYIQSLAFELEKKGVGSRRENFLKLLGRSN